MIVPKDSATSKTPLKSNPTSPVPQGFQSTSSSPPVPPPAYTHINQPYPVRHVVVQQGFVYRQSPSRRFWSAFFVAILVWLLLSMLGRSIAAVAYRGGGWFGDFPVPSNIALEDCVIGDRWFAQDITNQSSYPQSQSMRFRYSSEAFFDVPFSADNVFLLARGSQSHGTVNVETSKTGDSIKFHVTVSYYNRRILKTGAKVCLIKRRHNEMGVGIFTRNWANYWWRGSELYFDTTIVIPESMSGDKVRHIKGFETDVSNSPHYIGNLQKLVDFRNMNIKTTNAHIHAESVRVTEGVFLSSNGAIEGIFNTSDDLVLRTTNSHIKVDVGLENDDTHATTLKMSTTNSKLEANVNMAVSSKKGGKYDVIASTTNSPLRLDFPTSPINSSLKLSATTTNSPASVSLHPAYEGSFQLSTTQFVPNLSKHDVTDPSGKGRERRVESSSFGRYSLRGSVSWSEKMGPGSATIRTTNAPVTLEL